MPLRGNHGGTVGVLTWCGWHIHSFRHSEEPEYQGQEQSSAGADAPQAAGLYSFLASAAT